MKINYNFIPQFFVCKKYEINKRTQEVKQKKVN